MEMNNLSNDCKMGTSKQMEGKSWRDRGFHFLLKLILPTFRLHLNNAWNFLGVEMKCRNINATLMEGKGERDEMGWIDENEEY